MLVINERTFTEKVENIVAKETFLPFVTMLSKADCSRGIKMWLNEGKC